MTGKSLRRPSPAMVVALIALFVALGGTSYAAVSLAKNSVGSKQLKKGAVTTSKIKNGAVTSKKLNLSGVTSPNAAALGGLGPSSYEGRAMWAQVTDGGSILAQSGGISVKHPFTGAYYIGFPRKVTGKAIIATASDFDELYGEGVEASPCGTTVDSLDCSPQASNAGKNAFVATYNTDSDSGQNASFYIAVLP